MTTELVQPAPGGLTKLAQDLLKAAAELGLAPAVVEWSPTRNGFVVPATVAAAYTAETSGMDAGPADTEATVTDPVQAEEFGTARRYSDDEKAQAVALVLDDGRTIRAVAEEIGASENTVSRWVKAAKTTDGDS